MKMLSAIVKMLMMLLLVTGCNVERPGEPAADDGADLVVVPTQAAAEYVALLGWPTAGDAAAKRLAFATTVVDDFERQELTPGIAFYSCTIQVGGDPRNKIGLYRVVKESEPWRPRPTATAVFLQHGDAKNFQGVFLPGLQSPTLPDDFGMAAYWAQADVDVWGIDQAWNFVPAETTEFGFMADWGLEKEARDLGLAIAIARGVRDQTDNTSPPMIVLGYSSGSAVGYVLLNFETQLPLAQRQVGGWIPVDYSPISDDLGWNDAQNCIWIDGLQQSYDNGEYGWFVGFDYLGNLARNDPDGESPMFPGFTNLQAAMWMGGGTIFNHGAIHYLAANWQNDLPVDFRYVTVDQWLDFMVTGSPWQPLLHILDLSVWGCMETEVPWDDHFAEITIPVLNVAAAGGIGPTTHWCLTQLGSSDIVDLTIQLEADEDALHDFGHIDICYGNNAPELVWDPLLDWIEAHTPALLPELVATE